MRDFLKRLAIGLLIFIALAVLVNINFFWKNLKFTFTKPKTQSSIVPAVLQPNWLFIDSLGIASPVVYVGQKTEAAYQAALKHGVAHYPGTASPGAAGNCFIFGHSSDYFWVKNEYKAALALLPRAKVGDEIRISDAGGVMYTYKIISSKVIPADNLSVLSQETDGKSLLTIQTSYPLGTAWKRWVVQAELKK